MTKLPCDTCRGKCCSFAPFTRREFKDVRRKHGIPDGSVVVEIAANRRGGREAVLVMTDEATGRCAYLVDGRCSIYADRPNLCRLFGVHPMTPCPVVDPEGARARSDAAHYMRHLAGPRTFGETTP